MRVPHRPISDLLRQRKSWSMPSTPMAGFGNPLAGAAGFPPFPQAAAQAAGKGDASALREVTGFAPDPGALRMFLHLPADLPPGAPLVVALHGCTQDAAGFDTGCGWSTLADRHGFALLLPEQRSANNSKTCFNWFEPGDTTRGQGEAASIRAMVAWAVEHHGLDGSRVFVTGLSAGGGMTAVLLATYPEVFAGGAIIGGLPFGAAQGVGQAFEAMFTGRPRPASEWAGLVRAASPHRGPWPRLSVWQGEADHTVRPVNAEEIVKQWLPLHGLSPEKAESRVQGQDHERRWRDASGRVVVESHLITGMGHGVPLAPGTGENQSGVAGPYLLDVGIDAPGQILRFWDLGEVAKSTGTERSSRLPPVIAVGRDGGAHLG